MSVIAAEAKPPVLAVDLDGTLIRSDALHEQAVRMLFRAPRALVGLLGALTRGKAAVKAYCAEQQPLEAAALPYCGEVIDYIRGEKEAGARVVLCTAADWRVAEAVAAHVGVFDEVIASRDGRNLKGEVKAEELARRFPEGFVYAGDHAADLPVWRRAAGIVLVGVDPNVAEEAKSLGVPVVATLRTKQDRPAQRLKLWARALRAHQWSKNLLMLAPLVLAHQWFNMLVLRDTLLGFVAALVVISASYLVNDLADLSADRSHATKRFRPLASGSLTVVSGVVAAAVMMPAGLVGALMLEPWFFITLLAYALLTLAYSFRLKRIPLLDTFVIAALFTLRLLMGAVLVKAELPVWLVTFSMFFFFSLAMAKRHTEVIRALRSGGDSLKSRGYQPDDWPLTLSLGLATGMSSLIILMLYLVNEAFQRVGYARPAFLWFIAPLLAIWIGRIWLLSHRGLMHDDPVRFALRDRTSWGLGLLVALSFGAAL